MSKLDESRHSSICGMGTGQFYRQDGKLFDMFTLEDVDPTKIPKSTEEISLICKFCGAKRGTAEMMHEHLVAKHGAQITKSKTKEKNEIDRQGAGDGGDVSEQLSEAKAEQTNPETSEEKTEEKSDLQEPKRKPGRPKKKEINENA